MPRLRLGAIVAIWLITAVGLAACDSDNGRKVIVDRIVTTTAPTTTTTLSAGECLRLIVQAQAGTLVVNETDYRTKCGALPTGAVLAATTTTTSGAPPVPNHTAVTSQSAQCVNGATLSGAGFTSTCVNGRWVDTHQTPRPYVPPPQPCRRSPRHVRDRKAASSPVHRSDSREAVYCGW
jgi:hypothetical protein